MEDLREIQEAIACLREDISLKQKQIEQLNQFRDLAEHGLSETQYHDLCRTDMRCSDLLGQALLKVFPFLQYDRRGANYFYYKLSDEYAFEEGVEIRIPNSAVNGVEIVLEKYRRNSDASHILREYNYKKSSLESEIERLEKYLASRSVVTRAKIAFPSCPTGLAVLHYIFGRKKGKDELFDKLRRAFEERDAVIKSCQEKVHQAEERYAEQQALLKITAARFLDWTEEVRIYQRHWESEAVSFMKGHDGEIILKDRGRF